MKLPRYFLPLLFTAPLFADVAWIDVDYQNGTTAALHSSLDASDGATTSTNGLTFTLVGASIDGRNRSNGDDLLKDFAFASSMVLQIQGLAAGTYDVESWHFDGDGYSGAVDIGVRSVGQSTTSLITNFAFSDISTAPATYQITADGSSTYEIVITDTIGTSQLTRFNGLRIRQAGSTASPPLNFIDATSSNTVASGGSPSPFSITASDPGGNLWKSRSGFGFDVNGRTGIYEKDATTSGSNVGDAALLETTATGLIPGQEYGVYACFMSIPAESWRVRAGLDANMLTEFTPSGLADYVFDLGANSVQTTINEYLGFIGNAIADGSGNIIVYIDDAEGTGNTERTWYEGIALGAPYTPPSEIPLPEGTVEIAPDGVWTWFNDERAIFHNDALYSGYVRSDGHVGLTRYEPSTGISNHMQLSTSAAQEVDDHNNPSITVLPDGNLLVVYARHIRDNFFFYRISTVPNPSSDSDWGPELTQATPARTTYSNTYRLSEESDKIYNFQRNTNFNPTVSISTDNGQTWTSPAHFIKTGTGGTTRPYHRYISNHRDRIDLIYTDAHPVNDPTSLYHIFYKEGNIHYTDGSVLKSFSDIPLEHDLGERGTVIYPYTATAWGPNDGPDDWIPTGRAWNWDIHYDQNEYPVCVFQVERDNVVGNGWNNHRIYYYYARWTGTEWQRRFIAHAGRGIYNQAPNYGGGMAIDPEDPRIVYISSNAATPFDLDPDTINNVPLTTNERYEIWKGFTADGGLTFEWTAITQDSEADNLRPIVPENHGRTDHLLWFYGRYTTYIDYQTKVIGIFGTPKKTYADWRAEYGLSAFIAQTEDSDLDGASDLLEYALLADPTDASDSPVTSFSDGQFSFYHSPLLTDVEWSVETSVNLDRWDEIARVRAGGLPNDLEAGYSLITSSGDPMMLSIVFTPEDGEESTFFRVKVVPLFD